MVAAQAEKEIQQPARAQEEEEAAADASARVRDRHALLVPVSPRSATRVRAAARP